MCFKEAYFRYYEELNDFLPKEKRKKIFSYYFTDSLSIKSAIVNQGVPHDEVDLVLANGTSVSFDYQLQVGDRISIYPVFESLDISSVTCLRDKPLRQTKFLVDGDLDKLDRKLRMFGYDVLYRNDLQEAEVMAIALRERRIILTRDQELLKNEKLTHGYLVQTTDVELQFEEIIRRFDLYRQTQTATRMELASPRGVEPLLQE